jgi:hypothetical protein
MVDVSVTKSLAAESAVSGFREPALAFVLTFYLRALGEVHPRQMRFSLRGNNVGVFFYRLNVSVRPKYIVQTCNADGQCA